MRVVLVAGLAVFIGACGGGSGGDEPTVQSQVEGISSSEESVNDTPAAPVIVPESVEPVTESEPEAETETLAMPTDDTVAEPEPIADPEPESMPIAGECIDTPPLNDGFGWNGVESCTLPIQVVEAPPVAQPEPEPTPAPEPVSAPEPDHIVRIGFDGVVAYALDFETSQFGRLQVNSLFTNNTRNTVDAQCRIELVSGFNQVATSFIAIDDLKPGETAPSLTTFLGDSLNTDSFDTVRLSGCFTSNSMPVTFLPTDRGFDFETGVQFEGIDVYILPFSFSDFGRLQVNGVFFSTRSDIVDVQCRVALINGLREVDSTFVSVDDFRAGESVPDSSGILDDTVGLNSFDQVRVSQCFTL